MPDKKTVCRAVLVLMVASFSLVAADFCLFAHGEHQFGQCPICTWVHCLAMDQPVDCVVLLVLLVFCLLLLDTLLVWIESFRWLFAARPPPASATN